MANLLRWTSTLIDAFYQHGARHAVISPGSRSTPLAVAAAIHPGIQKKVVLDERSAAFIALGIAKKTGKPALLICTSGTAAANYFPAVIEAKESGVPLIILTADRPPNLRQTGSSQTIDQIKLFGSQAVFFHEAGEASGEDSDFKRLRFLARQAVSEAIKKGGAAHINLPFRKPLEPAPGEIAAEKKKLKRTSEFHPEPVSGRILHLDSRISKQVSSSEKPLIIAGPANPHHALNCILLNLAERLNAPVIHEPGSRIDKTERSVKRYELFLRHEKNLPELKPDLIIRFGDQPYTKSVLTALNFWNDTDVIHLISRNSWQDHAMNAICRIEADPADIVEWPEPGSDQNNSWINSWKKFDSLSEKKLEAGLQKQPELTDGHVFHHLGRYLNEKWNVMISNSFPVRDMAMFGESSKSQFVNRGAAGIDGIISTALGIHHASREPVCCITGDLAFLHDSNVLLSLEASNEPLLIVVINNNGGTIFRMLPVHSHKDLYKTYFETPQHADLSYLAKAHSINYVKISSRKELEGLDPSRIRMHTLVECVTSADESMALRKDLWGD